MPLDFKNPTPQGQDEPTQRAFDALQVYVNTSIFRQVTDGSTTAYTFSVPQRFTHVAYRLSVIAGSATERQVQLLFNGDSTAGHYYRDIVFRQYADAAAGAGFSANDAALNIGDIDNDSNRLYFLEGIIPLYTNTSFKKVVKFSQTMIGNASAGNDNVQYGAGSWESTAAITQITVQIVTTAWAAGGLIEFYGIL